MAVEGRNDIMADPKTLDQMLKEGLIKKGSDKSFEYDRFPIGIPGIDNLLGGGLPSGRNILLYGPESTGKTLLAQYFARTIQKTSRPYVVYVDNEGTYDELWWSQTGVDTEALMVSRPITAEQTIDMFVGLLRNMNDLGMIILDSIAAMVPAAIENPNLKAEETNQPGRLAHVVTMMYQKIEHLLLTKGVVLVTMNQMRANIGGYDELAALPGGRAQRHYSHIILRTSRENWIKQGEKKVGFNMEIESKKNKTCSVPDGETIVVPFLAAGQIDMLTLYIEDGIKTGIITRAGPYYKTAGKSFLGLENLRNFFLENKDEMELLENNVSSGHS